MIYDDWKKNTEININSVFFLREWDHTHTISPLFFKINNLTWTAWNIITKNILCSHFFYVLPVKHSSSTDLHFGRCCYAVAMRSLFFTVQWAINMWPMWCLCRSCIARWTSAGELNVIYVTPFWLACLWNCNDSGLY